MDNPETHSRAPYRTHRTQKNNLLGSTQIKIQEKILNLMIKIKVQVNFYKKLHYLLIRFPAYFLV